MIFDRLFASLKPASKAGRMPGFDREYYLRTNPDVSAKGVDPLAHYLESGWKEGRAPSEGFDGEAYLRRHPDVREAGVNPLVHFLEVGLREGRALPGFGPSERKDEATDMPGFDRDFYLRTNPDVAAAGLDPLRQYLTEGWKQGRSPSAGFDGDAYLALNPDVAEAEVNPLVHFLRFGLAEDRPWKTSRTPQNTEVPRSAPPRSAKRRAASHLARLV